MGSPPAAPPDPDPERGVLLRSYAVTHPPGLDLPARTHGDWDQLAYAARGVMAVDTDAGRWVVPPQRAVWIPAGVPHALRMNGAVEVRAVFLHRRARPRPRLPRPEPVCRAVAVPPLLRELVLEVCRRGVLYVEDPAAVRLAGVLLDQVRLLPDAALALPSPVEPRAAALARRLLERPELTLAEAVREVGASRRTLERVFQGETHLTLGQWHRRARLSAALGRLARGEPVTRVALDVGYRSPSAFISAFRATLGRTPARYFDVPDGGVGP